MAKQIETELSKKLNPYREAYQKASFYDYPHNQVPTSFSTRMRFFFSDLQEQPVDRQSSPVFKTLLSISAVETIFHLPNYFRQTLLVNSNKISFVNRSDALLELMNYMFRLNSQSKPISDFKIKHFLKCYQGFFSSTLIYESIFLASRLQAFSFAKDNLFDNDLVAGAFSGLVGQTIAMPWHQKSLQNSLGTRNEFIKVQSEGIFKTPNLLGLTMARGSVLGLLHMGLGRKLLQFLEQDLDPLQTKSANVDLRTAGFINLVPFQCQDKDKEESGQGNQLLHKLQMIGYFDQGRDIKASTYEKSPRRYEFVNLMLTSMVSAFFIGFMVTPLDMALVKMKVNTTNMRKQASFYQVLTESLQRPGGVTALMIAQAATSIRYFFVLTCVNCYLNALN